MRPSLTSHNQGNHGNASAKLFGNGGILDALCGKYANLAHVIGIQLSHPCISSRFDIAASLCVHVPRVITLRACKEMVRVAALAVVTSVEGAIAIGKRAVMQLVAKAVGVDDLFVNPHHAVSITKRALPLPTVGEQASVKMFPESVGGCNRGARGMILHSKSPARLAHATGRFAVVAVAILFRFSSFILPHLNEYSHVRHLTMEVSL